jgi:hypothetical protein
VNKFGREQFGVSHRRASLRVVVRGEQAGLLPLSKVLTTTLTPYVQTYKTVERVVLYKKRGGVRLFTTRVRPGPVNGGGRALRGRAGGGQVVPTRRWPRAGGRGPRGGGRVRPRVGRVCILRRHWWLTLFRGWRRARGRVVQARRKLWLQEAARQKAQRRRYPQRKVWGWALEPVRRRDGRCAWDKLQFRGRGWSNSQWPLGNLPAFPRTKLQRARLTAFHAVGPPRITAQGLTVLKVVQNER